MGIKAEIINGELFSTNDKIVEANINNKFCLRQKASQNPVGQLVGNEFSLGFQIQQTLTDQVDKPMPPSFIFSKLSEMCAGILYFLNADLNFGFQGSSAPQRQQIFGAKSSIRVHEKNCSIWV